MFLKRSALLAVVLGIGLMLFLTAVKVSEIQVPDEIAATHAEMLIGDSGDANSGESLASIFGLALWALFFLAYLVALTFIDRVWQSRR